MESGNSKLGENFISLLGADHNCYSDESQNRIAKI